MKRTGKFKNLALASSLVLSASMITSCNKAPRNYDILSDASEFVQSAVHTPRKVDILWVIDNSGSMRTSQESIATSFQSFIARFQNLDYDFHMGVITTEAYQALYPIFNKPDISLLRDGTAGNPSGYPILDKTLSAEELEEAFIKNIMQGINGSGDERAFQSLQAAFLHPGNEGFLREGAFLAIIMVTDEDDFSHDTISPYNPTWHTLHDPLMYVDLIADITGLEPKVDFSVSSIAILDEQCRDSLNDTFQERIVADRYIEMSLATDGVIASLCDDFADSLELISDSIIELAAVFPLDRKPIVSSIRVLIDGKLVPQSEINGWTYLDYENAIRFHGTAVPQQGSSVRIDFDPAELIR